MPKNPLKILAINPGTKYLGIAVFQNNDLRDWAIKVIPGKWSMEKLIKIQAVMSELFSQHHPDTIALKSLDPSRRSGNLESLVTEIQTMAKKKGIAVHEYSIEDLKRFYSPEERINKRMLAELVAAEYPDLFHELERELKIEPVSGKKHLKKYYGRMFEAAALGALCFYSLDKRT